MIETPGRYKGYCRGGPYDGMQLVNFYKTMRVPLLKEHPDLREVPAPDKIDVDIGEYHWVAEQWIWRGPDKKEEPHR
jgi:hypothetical protein